MARMRNNRYPKAAMLGEISGDTRRGHPFTRYVDVAKCAVQAAGIAFNEWFQTAQYRLTWRGVIRGYIEKSKLEGPGKKTEPTRIQPPRLCKAT